MTLARALLLHCALAQATWRLARAATPAAGASSAAELEFCAFRDAVSNLNAIYKYMRRAREHARAIFFSALSIDDVVHTRCALHSGTHVPPTRRTSPAS